jgi:OmcA/MtrC family decaheme c-type cytochrome
MASNEPVRPAAQLEEGTMRRTLTFGGAAAGISLALLAACQEPPRVGPRAGTTAKAPGARIRLDTASVNAGDHIVVTFHATKDDQPLGTAAVKALEPRWTLAVLDTQPVGGGTAWRSLLLNGDERLAQLPVAGPGTPPDRVLADVAQPGSVSEGVYSDAGNGVFTFTFPDPIPPELDRSLTLRVGVWLDAVKGTALTASTYDFAPTGEVRSRELVLDERCSDCHGTLLAHEGTRSGTRLCVTCHTFQNADADTVDPAALVGATPATNPNPLDLGRLVHRVHRGKNLPTLYESSNRGAPAPTLPSATPLPLPFLPGRATNPSVLGRNFSVVGEHQRERVFGAVQSRIDNNLPARTIVEGVVFPRDYRDCDACHEQAKDAALVDSQISRWSCQGCHPDVWFGDTAPAAAVPPDTIHFAHPGGPQADDTRCAACHVGGDPAQKVYAPIADVHVALVKSPRYDKPVVKILEVRDLVAGRSPTIVFTVEDRMGALTTLPTPPNPVDPTNPIPRTLSRVSVAIAGMVGPDFVYAKYGYGTTPETTITFPFSETIVTTSTTAPLPPIAADASGRFTVTLKAKIPEHTMGTWLVTMSATRPMPATPLYSSATDEFAWPYTGESVSVAADTANVWVDAGTGTFPGAVTPRRQIVDPEKCNKCHLRLSGHGSRNGIDYCASCHTPARSDWGRRPKVSTAVQDVVLASTPDGIEERSVQLKTMLHRIHTGGRSGTAELAALEPFFIYGHAGADFFGEVEFPGELSNCLLCHVEESYTLEAVPADAAPTVANETPTILHAGTVFPTEDVPRTPAVTSACNSCHATAYAEFHTLKYLIGGKEQCVSCHGAKGALSVRKAHGLREATP